MQVNEDRWSAQRIENKSGPSLTCQPHLGLRANLRLVGGSPCPPAPQPCAAPTSETSWRGNGKVPKRRKEVYLVVSALGEREGRDGMGVT